MLKVIHRWLDDYFIIWKNRNQRMSFLEVKPNQEFAIVTIQEIYKIVI